jgi:hypothetical protein
LNLRSPQDIVSKVPAEFIRSSQIDLAADYFGELTLHRRQSEITNTAIRFEFHQDLDWPHDIRAYIERRVEDAFRTDEGPLTRDSSCRS